MAVVLFLMATWILLGIFQFFFHPKTFEGLKKVRGVAKMSVLGIFLIPLSLIFDEFFWWMIIVYVILGAFIFFSIIRLVKPFGEIPQPTGKFSVGKVNFELIDDSRKEVFGKDNDKSRRFMVSAWYPAEATTEAPIRYTEYPEQYMKAYKKMFGIPESFFNHISLIMSHSVSNAPIAKEISKYPTLLFSHGYGGFENQNTCLVEELASHGYIVFSLSHPFDSGVVIFPDKTEMYYEETSKLTSKQKREGVKKTKTLHENNANAKTLEEKIEILKMYNFALYDDLKERNSLDMWIKDTQFLLDQLFNSESSQIPINIRGHVDLKKIGAFGHSYGGTTAGEICLLDDRVGAGINMDGLQWDYGHVLEKFMGKPFMCMYSEGGKKMNDVLYLQSTAPCYSLTINGTEHMDYSDATLFFGALRRIGLRITGKIKGKKMIEFINRITLKFFDKYVKQVEEKEDLIVNFANKHPEIELDVRYT